MDRLGEQLDKYITGNYGEDQFLNCQHEETEKCTPKIVKEEYEKEILLSYEKRCIFCNELIETKYVKYYWREKW